MLKPIIEAIVPENIKNITLVQDSLDIFIDFIIENSDITLDIKNMFKKEHNIVNAELLKIYLNNVYNLFSDTRESNLIYEAFQNDPLLLNSGAEIPTLQPTESIMDIEQYLTSKNYKEAKGTKLGFQYVYDLVLNSGIIGNVYKDSESYFAYGETGNIFEYTINGAISPQLYTILVEPITHPLGWNYLYTRLISSVFNDYFKLNYVYDFTGGFLQVKCQLSGPDKVHDYVSGTIYYEGDPGTVIGYITEVSDFTVDFIETLKLEKGFKTSVYFASGEVLVSTTFPITTKLYANRDDADAKSTPLIDYDEIINETVPHCSLFLDYDVQVNTSVEDVILFTNQWNLKDYADHKYTTPAIIGESAINNFLALGTDDNNEIATDSDNTLVLDNGNLTYVGQYPLVGGFIIGGALIEKRLKDVIDYFEVHLVADSRELDKTTFSNITDGVGYKDVSLTIGGGTIGLGTITTNLEEFFITTYK